MMILMDRLTDKVDWHKKVLDEEIVAKWRKEALEQPEDDLYSQITENKNTEHYPKPRGRVLSGDAFDYVRYLYSSGSVLIMTRISASRS